MQIQSSLWIKLRRLCAQYLAQDEPLCSQIDSMINRIVESAPSEQQQVVAYLFETLGRLPNAVELGFQIGRHIPVTAFGTMSLGILTAPTIGEALQFIADVHHLESPIINLSYERTTSEGRFTIGFRHLMDSAAEAFIVAVCTAAIDREIGRSSERTGNIARLELTHSSKGMEADYQKYLSLTPHTSGNSNRLVFGRSILKLANITADVDTFNNVVSTCMKRAEFQINGVPLHDRVHEVIMSNISAPPSLERLAKILGMTPRRLRALLNKEHTSYQTIIRDCRTEYARAQLKNPSVSLSQIADRLGYSDLTAFSHSFNRWTGKSPSALRIEMHSRCEAS